MKSIRDPQRVTVIGVVLATVLLGAGPVFAEPQAWNPKEAKRLAQEFAQTIDKLAEAAKTAPPQETAFQQRTRDSALTQMGRMREAADGLVKRIGAAESASDSRFYFEQVRALYQSMLKDAGDAVAAPQQRPNLTAANQALEELGRYYTD